MATASVYVRVSTPGQVEDGLGQDMQLSECYAIAERFDLEIDPERIVIEQASGEFMDRDGLDKIREMVRSEQIDSIIAYDIDRLSRNEMDTLIIFNEAREYGVKIYTRHGVGGDQRIDFLLTHLRAFSAAEEKDKTRRRTMDGKIQTIKQANVLPCGTGSGLYGYDYVPRSGSQRQHMKINEAEAVIVRELFSRANDGWELSRLTKDLNNRGIATKKSGRWHTKTVKSMLTNPSYMGKTYYGKEKTTLQAKGKQKRSFRPKEEWLEVEGFTPALVSEKVFNTVQAHLNRPNRRTGHPHATYMLSGMAKCGECGQPITGQKMSRNENYRYYACRGSNNHYANPCKAKRSRVSSVDDRVWEGIVRIFSYPTELEKAIEVGRGNLFREQNNKRGVQVSKKLTRRLFEVTKQEEALLDLIQRTPSAASSIAERLEKIAAEKVSLESTILAATPKGGSGLDELTMPVKQFAAQWIEKLQTSDTDERKTFLNKLGFQALIGAAGGQIQATVKLPELFTTERTSGSVEDETDVRITVPVNSLLIQQK